MKCALFHPAVLVHWAQKNACPGGKTTMKKTFFLLCALLLVLAANLIYIALAPQKEKATV